MDGLAEKYIFWYSTSKIYVKNLIKIQVADSCTVSTALTNFLIYSKVLVVAHSNLYIWKHFLIYKVKT